MSFYAPPVSASETRDPTIPPAPPPKRSNVFGRMWQVYADAMDESGPIMKGIFKLTSCGSFWMKYFNPNAPTSCSKVGELAKNAKNITSVIEWPVRANKLQKSLGNFDSSSPIKSTANVVSELCSVMNNGSDTAEFVNTISPLPSQVMEKVKVANSAATLVGSLKSSVDTVGKISTNIQELRSVEDGGGSEALRAQKTSKAWSKITSNLMSLTAKVCYVALGALGLAALFTPVAPVVTVSLLTTGTVIGLANLFFDRIVDPNDDRVKKLAQNPLFQRAVEFAKG